MNHRPALESSLSERVIALPESRQLDILAALFERRRARVLRVPLVSIHDAPDQGPVIAWLRRFIARPADILIILTGEGLRRLLAAARRQGLEQDFLASLEPATKLCRGPKPGRALKEVGMAPDLQAESPTTAGIIATLETMSLTSKRVAVQLYGEDPNLQLMNYLHSQDLAVCDTVAPYVYGDASESAQVEALIRKMGGGEVDLIAFTSKPQIHRLVAVAEQCQLQDTLRRGWRQTLVAAVGPVVANELSGYGCEVQVMPKSAYFMKPLVRAAEAAFATGQDGADAINS